MNVHQLQILAISLLAAVSLSGCGTMWGWLSGQDSSPDPRTTITKPADKTPLNLPLPEPLRLKPVQWLVVTPHNVESVFRHLESQGIDPVLFALSDDGYMSLAQSMSEVRGFMNTQRLIIIEYKKYYEGTTVPAPKP